MSTHGYRVRTGTAWRTGLILVIAMSAAGSLQCSQGAEVAPTDSPDASAPVARPQQAWVVESVAAGSELTNLRERFQQVTSAQSAAAATNQRSGAPVRQPVIGPGFADRFETAKDGRARFVRPGTTR